MSSVILKKPRGEHKPGALISVPFGVGQIMVANGEAEFPKQSAIPQSQNVAVPTIGQRHAEEIKRLNAVHAAAVQDLREEAEAARKKAEKEHAEEVELLKSELDAAHKTIAELNAKAKK
jgi:hypothetical protein